MRCFACAERLRGLGRRGTTSLEFALIGPLLVLLLMGGMEAGRYLAMRAALHMAGAEAVRAAILQGGRNLATGLPGCAGLAGPLGGVAGGLPLLDATKLEITLSNCVTAGAVTRVTVSLRYTHGATLPVFRRTLAETAPAVFN